MAESTRLLQLRERRKTEEHLKRAQEHFQNKLKSVGVVTEEEELTIHPKVLTQPLSIRKNEPSEGVHEQKKAEEGEYTPDHLFLNLDLAWQNAKIEGLPDYADTLSALMTKFYNDHGDQLSELSRKRYEAIRLSERQELHFPILPIILPWLKKIQISRALNFPLSIIPGWSKRRKH